MHSENDFFKYIDQIIEYTGIDRAEVFNGCYDLYQSVNFTAKDLLQISTNLKVDPVKLWNRNLDLESLKNSRYGINKLPTIYSEVRASNIVSLENTLHQFKKYGLYDYVLKKLQIDEKTIELNKSISVLAMTDLLDFSNGFFVERDYLDIARRNANFSYDNFFQKEINPHNSSIKITQNILELGCYFEQNWTYRIVKSDLKSITIETHESELMRSAKSYKPFTNNMCNTIRFSYIKAALENFGIVSEKITPLSEWDNPHKKFQFSVNIK